MNTFHLFFSNYIANTTEITVLSASILCLVSFIGSFISAAVGLGGGSLVLATMALLLPPIVLLPLHGAVQLGSNLGRTILMMEYILFPVIIPFTLGAALGVLIGGQLFIVLPIEILQSILAIFILYSSWSKKFAAKLPTKFTYVGVGLISSFITMFVGATGPLIAPFVANSSKIRQQVVSTHAILMSIQHSLKLIAFGFLGVSIGPYIGILIVMISFGFLGTYLGRFLLNRLPEAIFRISLKCIITLLALRLLFKAATGV